MAGQTPLVERMLRRLPGSHALWAVLLGMVPVAGAFLPHSFVATVGEAPIGRRLLAGLAFGYAVVLAVWAAGHFSRQIEEVRRSLIDHTTEDLFRGLGSVAGPLSLTLAFTVVTTARTALLADAGSAFAWIPVSLVTNFPLMSAFWIFAVMFLGIGRLGQHHLSLKAFPNDPSLGLSPVGRLAYMAFWVYAAASAPILVVNVGDPTRLVMSLAVFLIGVLIFFVALAGLHRQLVAARNAEISRARDVYARAYDTVRSGSVEALTKHASALIAAKTLIDEAQTIQRWPFEDRRFRQMAAIVGTFATFTATGVITRLAVVGLGLD